MTTCSESPSSGPLSRSCRNPAPPPEGFRQRPGLRRLCAWRWHRPQQRGGKGIGKSHGAPPVSEVATTRTVLRLRPDVIDALSRRGEASGRTVDDVVAELLAEGLPPVLAEASAAGLRASLGRTKPVEAQVVERSYKEKGSGCQPRALPSGVVAARPSRSIPAAGTSEPVGGDGTT